MHSIVKSAALQLAFKEHIPLLLKCLSELVDEWQILFNISNKRQKSAMASEQTTT